MTLALLGMRMAALEVARRGPGTPGAAGGARLVAASDEVDAVAGCSAAITRRFGPSLVLPAPQPGRLAVVAAERRGERVGRCVAGAFCHLRERRLTSAQLVARERHSQVGQVLQRSLPERSLEAPREGGPRQSADGCQVTDRPRVGRLLVDGLKGRTQSRVGRSLEPAGGAAAVPEARADGGDEEDVERQVDDRLLAGRWGGELS